MYRIAFIVLACVATCAALGAAPLPPAVPGNPDSPTIAVTINNGSGTSYVAHYGTVYVDYMDDLSSLNLSIIVNDPNNDGVKITTTIANAAGAGLQVSEWGTAGSHLAVGFTLNPTSGLFDDPKGASYAVVIMAEDNSAGRYIGQKNFTIQQSPKPPSATIEVWDGATQVAHGQTAAGSRDFGTHDAYQLPTSWIDIEFKNTGAQALSYSVALATHAQYGAGTYTHFEINSVTASGTVGPAASAIVQFRYVGGGGAAMSGAMVEVTHNDPYETSPFSFELVGETTVSPNIQVSDSVGTVTNGDSPAGDRDFGTVDIAAAPTATAIIMIENNGSADLNLGQPHLTGGAAMDFVLDLTGFTDTLTPGSSTTFGVAFDPTTLGQKLASVVMTHTPVGGVATFSFDVGGVAFTTNYPTLLGTSMPDAHQNVAYGPEAIQAVGGTPGYTFAATSMPAGMSLSATGLLTGTPTQDGDFTFTVTVTDSIGASHTADYTLHVKHDYNWQGSGSEGGAGCTGGSGTGALLALVLLAIGVAVRGRKRAA